MTQRGQVTVPAEVRRLLHLKPRDKVAFGIDDDNKVQILPAKFTLESAFASVKPIGIKDVKKISRAARDEKAARDRRKLQRS
jgi:AbrB family looped-hinge helix DNA binding protein